MRITLLLLASLALAHIAHASPSPSCRNTLDDSFFNKCRREMPPGPLAALGSTVNAFYAPYKLAVMATIGLVLLPLVTVFSPMMPASLLTSGVSMMRRTHLHLMSFLHRMTYTLTLNVALYTVFRQHRPCECDDAVPGVFTQHGSIYGMPSGDSMAGGLVGAYIFFWQPFGYVWTARGVGVVAMLLKCVERLGLGFHSVGQVTAGASLGVLLGVYHDHAPQYTVFIDSFVMILLGVISFPLDHGLEYAKNDPDNIFFWYLGGVGFNLICCLFVYRFYQQRNWRGIRSSFKEVVELVGSESEDLESGYTDDALLLYATNSSMDDPLMGHSSNDSYTAGNDMLVPMGGDSGKASLRTLLKVADVRFRILMFVLCLGLQFVSNLADVYAWGYD